MIQVAHRNFFYWILTRVLLLEIKKKWNLWARGCWQIYLKRNICWRNLFQSFCYLFHVEMCNVWFNLFLTCIITILQSLVSNERGKGHLASDCHLFFFLFFQNDASVLTPSLNGIMFSSEKRVCCFKIRFTWVLSVKWKTMSFCSQQQS